MSQLTHARPRILPVRLLFRLKTGAAAVLIAATIAFALAISAQDNATPANVVTPATEGGVRYDGGPDEGTRGIARDTQSVTATEDGARYDGGPEEGSVGLGR